MWLVWIGVLLLAMKLLALGPVATWPWWWVLAPLALAIAWFEGLERLLGLDRRKIEHDDLRERQKERAQKALRGRTSRGQDRD